MVINQLPQDLMMSRSNVETKERSSQDPHQGTSVRDCKCNNPRETIRLICARMPRVATASSSVEPHLGGAAEHIV